MSQPQIITIAQAISKAKKAARRGNATLALQLYHTVLQHQPNHPVAQKGVRKLKKELPDGQPLQKHEQDPSQDQINVVINLFHSGQMPGAEQACRQLLQTYPRSLIVNNVLGVVLKELGRLEEAVQAYDKTIQLKPDYAVAYSNRGVALQELGKLKEAMASCDRAIELNPEYAEAYCNRGVTLQAQGESAKAVQAYDKALQIKHDYAEAHCNRGAALLELGQSEEALQTFEQAIQLKADYAEAYCNRGVTLQKLGQPEEAVQAFDQAIMLKPDYAEAYCNRGITLQELERSGEAVQAFNKAIHLKTDYAEAYFNRGVALLELGQPGEALQAFDQAIRLKPDYAEAYYNRGVTLQELEQPAKAVLAYDKAIQLKPDYAEAYCNRGSALDYLGQLKEAVVCWDKAIQLKPDYAKAYFYLGNGRQILGQLKEAKECFIRATQVNPDYADAHRCLSNLKKYKSNDPQIELMEKLFSNSELGEIDRAHLGFALANTFDSLGEHDKSFNYLKEGNRLRYKEMDYDINDDTRKLSKIKEIFMAGRLSPGEAPEGNASIKKLFIVGMPRSGTSLVEQILASHTLVHGAGELETMNILVHPILSNLLGQNFSQNPSTISPNDIKTVRDSYLEVLAALDVPEKVITDKMPLNFQFIGIILSAFPDAKIVHVNRDPRATCWSIYRHYFSTTGNGYAYEMSALAEFYKLYIDLMSFWRERFPDSIYDLYYENLTENQEQEARKLMQFCDLEWEEQCLDFHKTKRAVRTASNTQVRKKMYKGSSDAWRKYEGQLQPLISDLGF